MICWLIETEIVGQLGNPSGHCLGFCGRNHFVWTTPALALHFSCKKDAEMMAGILITGCRTIVVEHVFS